MLAAVAPPATLQIGRDGRQMRTDVPRQRRICPFHHSSEVNVMTSTSLARTSTIAALVFGAAMAAHVVLQQHAARSPSTTMMALYLACSLLIGLGWIGLNQLRALDKRSLVKTLQVVTALLAASVLLLPGARTLFIAAACSVVVFAAFPLALWYRRQARLDRH